MNDYSEGFQRKKKEITSMGFENLGPFISFPLGRSHFSSGRWGSFFTLNSPRKEETITLLIVHL